MRVKYSISSTVESETFLFSDSRILLVLFLTIIDQKRRAILQEGKLIQKGLYNLSANNGLIILLQV